MITTITVRRTASPMASTDAPRYISISLSAPPFDIPQDDRSATAPTGRTIRGECDWRKDRVLRSAVRIKT